MSSYIKWARTNSELVRFLAKLRVGGVRLVSGLRRPLTRAPLPGVRYPHLIQETFR